MQTISKPIIIAHRGSSKKAPENTLAAFNAAWKEDADGIEADFHLTKDHHIVCIHDKNTRRTTGANKVIKETTLSELKKLDAGKFKKRYKRERISTLEEVLETVVPGKKIYIEIKSAIEILPYLSKSIKDSKLSLDQFIIMSFNDKLVARFKEDNPKIKSLLLIDFNNNDFFPKRIPTSSEALELLKKLKIDGYASKELKKIPLSFINDICDNGLDYHIWTVNRKRRARKYKNSQVSAIITDVPKRIKAALK